MFQVIRTKIYKNSPGKFLIAKFTYVCSLEIGVHIVDIDHTSSHKSVVRC